MNYFTHILDQVISSAITILVVSLIALRIGKSLARLHVDFYAYIGGMQRKVHSMNLKVNDQLPLSIQAADEFGNPTAANFDSPPAWSVSDSTVAAVAPSADGLSAVVTSPSGKLASCTVQVAGTVGGQAVQGSLQLTMVAGDTAEITVVPGTPTAAPAPAAPAAPAASS